MRLPSLSLLSQSFLLRPLSRLLSGVFLAIAGLFLSVGHGLAKIERPWFLLDFSPFIAHEREFGHRSCYVPSLQISKNGDMSSLLAKKLSKCHLFRGKNAVK